MTDTKKPAPLTLTDLDELERLEREATGGEWRAVSLGTKIGRSDAQGRAHICGTHRQEGVVSKHEGGTNPSSDARLIAAARNRLPQLLALARVGVLAVAEREAHLRYMAADGCSCDADGCGCDEGRYWQEVQDCEAVMYAAIDAYNGGLPK